jgi:hypothetical protein
MFGISEHKRTCQLEGRQGYAAWLMQLFFLSRQAPSLSFGLITELHVSKNNSHATIFFFVATSTLAVILAHNGITCDSKNNFHATIFFFVATSTFAFLLSHNRITSVSKNNSSPTKIRQFSASITCYHSSSRN